MCLGRLEKDEKKLRSLRAKKKYKFFLGTLKKPISIMDQCIYPKKDKDGFFWDTKDEMINDYRTGFHFETWSDNSMIWRHNFVAEIKVKQITAFDIHGGGCARAFKIVKIIKTS